MRRRADRRIALTVCKLSGGSERSCSVASTAADGCPSSTSRCCGIGMPKRRETTSSRARLLCSGGNMQGFWPKVVMAILVAGVTTTATGTGNHASNVVPGSPAVCVTLKLPQLPQPDEPTT